MSHDNTFKKYLQNISQSEFQIFNEIKNKRIESNYFNRTN